MWKKAYYKFSTYFWAFREGPGQPAAQMRSLANDDFSHAITEKVT